MATVITAGNATNGLSLTSDNTGSLDIKTGTGAGTTAISISSSQIATFAAGVSGTTGSFSGNMSFNSGYGSAAVAYGCRAWVNFNGTGTPAIRASGNVNFITDNGTGDYTVNFTTPMVDANYSVVGSAGDASTTASLLYNSAYNAAPTTSACRIGITNTAAANVDRLYVYVAVFR